MTLKLHSCSKNQQTHFLFRFFIFTILFLASVSVLHAESFTKTVGGTVTYPDGTPAVGVTVVIRTGTALTGETMSLNYQFATADASGYFSTTYTFFCSGMYSTGASVLLDDGSLSPGTGGGGGTSCSNLALSDWSHSLNFHLANPALNSTQNASDSCSLHGGPSRSVARPVNITNGNMWLQQMDYELPGVGDGLVIRRTYNSMIQADGLFGKGWSSKYDESLTKQGSLFFRLSMPDGQTALFGQSMGGSNVYLPLTSGFYGTVVVNPDLSVSLNFQDGRVHRFSSNGKLLSLADRSGNLTTLSYTTSWKLLSITDSFGRTINATTNTYGGITQLSDSVGVIASYEYYPSTTRLKTVTYPDGSKYKFEYTVINSKVYLTTVKDALDNILETHQYDSSGRATTSETQGGVEKYILDYSDSTYTTVTDALGRVTKYFFDKSGGKNFITKIEGNCGCGGGSEVTTFEYDNKLNLTKKTDALLNQTTYTYDTNGNPLTKTDVLGTETFTYNSFGEVVTYKDRIDSQNPDPNVNTVVNTYDTAGNLLTTKDALNNTTTFTYTAIGQPATVKDALNHTATLTYDTQGRLTQVTDANNKTTNFGYDARARVTSTTNALNETTSFEYDLNNRLKKVTYPDTNFITYTYDLAGRRTGVTDARNNTTTYAYDGAYRLTGITDVLNHAKTFGYDLMSNLTSQTDALNNTTNYEYDDFNRLKKVIYPAATVGATRLEESLTYDTVGNVKTLTNTGGRQTLYDYDTANRLTKVTDALNNATQFEYNARSQMTKVTDALNQQYTFTYDPLGRTLSQTRAGTTMSFEYDAVGNRTKRTDYSNRVTTYQYDNLNRLTQILYGGTVGATYTYDDLSRMLTAVNDAGTVSFTYDNRGRVKTTTDVFNHVIEYGYDANGNRNLLKLDGANYAVYAYDAADRLSAITNSADSTNIGFGYDTADRLTSRSYPNGVNTTYEYDGMSRLTRLKDVNPTSTLSDRQYSYNAANQISQIVEPNRTRTFGYDNVDRLTSATDTVNGNESYAYDAVGNRTSSHRSSTYTYQPYNRLTSTDTASYTYDANGTLALKHDANGDLNFNFDYENRLVTAYKFEGARVVANQYKYDALGRMVYAYPSGLWPSNYTYDGQDVIVQNYAGYAGYDTKFQNGPGIDNQLAVLDVMATDWNYLLKDHLGSINSSGSIYDSFGNPGGGGYADFTGRGGVDNFTGLIYFRARWYDPNLGRFTSEDPIGFRGGDINLYGYVWNNPLNFTDPTGLDGWGNDVADWYDRQIERNIELIGFDPIIDYNLWSGPTTVGDLARGYSNLLRVGNGFDHAIYAEDENPYGRAAYAAMDIQRAADLFVLLASPFAGGFGELSSAPKACPMRLRGRLPGPTLDPLTGEQVGRFIVDPNGNTMIEPVGGSTVPAGRNGVDTHTLYPNGSNYQRLNPAGHPPNNPIPHGHGHLPGTGPYTRGQGESIDVYGNKVPRNSAAAHWKIK